MDTYAGRATVSAPRHVRYPPAVSAPFTRLAEVYDDIMADVSYGAWFQFLRDQARARGAPAGRLLDLGCGTGNATLPAHEAGLPVDGLDLAPSMLDVARGKLPDVDFYEADVRTFTLPHRYALVYSVFDALNNLLDDDSFLAMARTVHAHLEPGGVFAFDANTTHGLRTLWLDGRAEGCAGDVYYRWLHTYDEERRLATVEAYCEGPRGAFTEVHQERPYDPADLTRLLREAGFAAIDVVRYPGGEPASEDDERVWVFATRASGT